MISVDVQGVRIHPGVIDIFDTEIGNVYKSQISVKNISSNSKKIRFYGPQSKVFDIYYAIIKVFVSFMVNISYFQFKICYQFDSIDIKVYFNT